MGQGRAGCVKRNLAERYGKKTDAQRHGSFQRSLEQRHCGAALVPIVDRSQVRQSPVRAHRSVAERRRHDWDRQAG